MKRVCLYDYFMITLNHKDVHRVYAEFSQLGGVVNLGTLGMTGTHEGFVIFPSSHGIADVIHFAIKDEV